MDVALKAKWVAALRSGEFKQGKGRLRHGGRHCCLGVLCEVAGRPIKPLAAVLEWRFAEEVGVDGCDDFLVRMNDDDAKSFAEIADWIEAHL